jgi:hypothetical protein
MMKGECNTDFGIRCILKVLETIELMITYLRIYTDL